MNCILTIPTYISTNVGLDGFIFASFVGTTFSKNIISQKKGNTKKKNETYPMHVSLVSTFKLFSRIICIFLTEI